MAVTARQQASRPIEIGRRQLIDRILTRPEPIVVLEGPAGTGKSALLAQLGTRIGRQPRLGPAPPPCEGGVVLLWDTASSLSPETLPEEFVAGRSRLVLAKRPETEVPGLARAIVYGKAFVLGAAELLFTSEELAEAFSPARAGRILERSGGWPLLLPFAIGRQRDDTVLSDMLERDLLRPMSVPNLVALGEVLAGRPISLKQRQALTPLVSHVSDSTSTPVMESLRAPLLAAYRSELARRCSDGAEAERVARALLDHHRPTEAIITLQGAGRFDAALAIINTAHGFFFVSRHGPAAFDRILAGFPSDYVREHESLIICLGVQALKRGDVARARQLVSDHLGETANQPVVVFGNRATYSLQFRFFRILMLIYEDVFITDELFEQIFALISELPADAHLERGSFYNSLLEFYIRRRRFAEAEDVAVHARRHYTAAQVPILQFYISLHRAVMRLMQGDAIEAQRFAAEAAADLAACDFDSPNDARLLALLRAAVEYEGGRAEPLARFLSLELDDFSHGEIWPTVIDLALHYGSQALSEHFSTIAARSFLDRWRVFQVHNRQFQAMIDIREATILQNGNRWQEAAEKLGSLQSGIGRDFVMSANGELARLQGRDQIALALAWLRQLVFETPSRPRLERQLEEVQSNLEISGRQRISIEVWLAYVHKRQRNVSKSRSLLQKTLERATRLGAFGPLAEERYFLMELVGNQRVHDFLQASPHLRQILRRLTDSGVVASPLGTKSGLSRRETKVLMMISEGGSNKFIANALGVSEATVKYHLGNVYRKLGCGRRRDAINAARALRLVN